MSLTVEGDQLFFGGHPVTPGDVLPVLGELITEARRDRIDNVIAGRSTHIAAVVEGSVNTGNVSAVMRTAEAFGVLPFHVIRSGDRFKNSSRTSQGAEKWLDLRYWDDSESCLRRLREDGYTIAATVPDSGAVPIDSLDYRTRTALVFGNEAEGISNELRQTADVVCSIPMTGFVESFNISVAAAICLYQAFLYKDTWPRLQESEADLWRAVYYYRSVRRADDILARHQFER